MERRSRRYVAAPPFRGKLLSQRNLQRFKLAGSLHSNLPLVVFWAEPEGTPRHAPMSSIVARS